MMNEIVLYGANGYTGKLIAQEAYTQKKKLHLAGRNEKAIEKIAKQFDFTFSVVELNENDKLDELLTGAKVVIHAAGPFTETARPMVEACLRTQTHYCDITGEIWAFEEVMSYHQQALEKKVSLVPGVGFDVVPTDCLAAILKEKMPDANSLEMAFAGDKTQMSRGTAVTMLKNVGKGGFIREDGDLRNVPLAFEVKDVQYSFGNRLSMTIPWGDLMTAYHNTGIPNIKVFNGAGEKTIASIKRYRSLKFLLRIGFIQKYLRKKVESSITGPSEELRNNGKTYIVGEVRNRAGEIIRMEMITPEAYKLTAQTALQAAENLKTSDTFGYQTPVQAFGSGFINEFEVKLIEKS